MAAAAPAAPAEATLTCRMPCGAAKLASALAPSPTAAPPTTGLSHRCIDCVCKILHKRLAAFVAEPTHWVRPQCPQRSGSRVPARMPAKVRLICLCVCVCLFQVRVLGCLIDAGASVECVAKGARRRRGTARVPRSAPIVCKPADRTVRCMRCGIRDQEHRI